MRGGSPILKVFDYVFALLVAGEAIAKEKTEKPPEAFSHTFRPERRDFSEARLRQLKVPPGFQVNVFARGLGNPRMLAVGDDGTVYVTCPDQGKVVALRDKQNKGAADERNTLVQNLKEV